MTFESVGSLFTFASSGETWKCHFDVQNSKEAWSDLNISDQSSGDVAPAEFFWVLGHEDECDLDRSVLCVCRELQTMTLGSSRFLQVPRCGHFCLAGGPSLFSLRRGHVSSVFASNAASRVTRSSVRFHSNKTRSIFRTRRRTLRYLRTNPGLFLNVWTKLELSLD